MGLLGSCCGKTDPSKTDTSMPGIELEKASATPHFQWAARNGPGAPRGPIVPKGPIVLVDEGTHAMQGAWWLWGQPEDAARARLGAARPASGETARVRTKPVVTVRAHTPLTATIMMSRTHNRRGRTLRGGQVRPGSLLVSGTLSLHGRSGGAI